MSIYKALSTEVPIIGYSVIHQPKKSITAKEYTDLLLDLRDRLKEESLRTKSLLENYVSDLSAKTVQAIRGNLSQFLTTPIQTDTDEIQRILKDQFINISEQFLPDIIYGILGGYESKYITDLKPVDMPNPRMTQSRSYLQKAGFKVARNSSTIFESFYIIQGGSNLDILEYIIRKDIDVNGSAHSKKTKYVESMVSSLYNLLFLDGTLALDLDKFELQINFTKDAMPYSLFKQELLESFKFFRTEIHNLNVSVWQRKLGLGIGEEYMLRIRTKDRSILRATISIMKRYMRERNSITDSIAKGTWHIKEIV
jgi:hypothetical protein